VRHDGGGGGRFGRGSTGRWWGVMRWGGAPAISGAKGGCREAACMCARETGVAASAVRPGEEDDRAGPACW
jgi:hypothetical protein